MFDPSLIKKFQSFPTPFYYYDMDLLQGTLSLLREISGKFNYKMHYALKANSNPRILSMIREYGFGADCVSGNEVIRAVESGFSPEGIVFAGVGKTDTEIKIGLKHNIHCFNCESVQEIEVIDQLAGEMQREARIALRINPQFDAGTHHYITTGLQENKFGIYLQDVEDTLSLVKGLKNVGSIGLHFHIGSQIQSMEVFKGLCLRINEIQHWLAERHEAPEHLNVGGGLGIDYQNPDEFSVPDFGSYFGVFRQFLEPLPNQTVHFELGRAVVGHCGSLISRVIFVKPGMETNFVILDAGMTELIRPALYQAYHKIENLTGNGTEKKYDVVGPVCESSDCFGKAVKLPETQRGDLIAVRSTGAYGQVMASQYNLRDLAPAIYSDELR
jgi:diaminopimelate decarboxylase